MRCAIVIALVIGAMSQGLPAQETKLTSKPSTGGEPTHADVKYGPYARNVMDVWLAKSDKPTPVLVAIHGGAFQNGNKAVGAGLRDLCLKAKISVVAITYRLSQDAITPAAFYDSTRAIQFIRHNAKEWNIDPGRIAATGDSAGGGISLWIAFKDEMADSDNPDPVLRHSTRLSCVATKVSQTSYDPRFVKRLIPENDTYKLSFFSKMYGQRLDDLDNLAPETYRLFEEVSPINHLTKDDPPVLMAYGIELDAPVTDVNQGIHHPRFGLALKEKMDVFGITCEVVKSLSEQTIFDFVTRHLAGKSDANN